MLEGAGVRLKPDRDQAWLDFNGWRVNYDAALLGVSRLAMAPPSWWKSTDHLGLCHRPAGRRRSRRRNRRREHRLEAA